MAFSPIYSLFPWEKLLPPLSQFFRIQSISSDLEFSFRLALKAVKSGEKWAIDLERQERAIGTDVKGRDFGRWAKQRVGKDTRLCEKAGDWGPSEISEALESYLDGQTRCGWRLVE